MYQDNCRLQHLELFAIFQRAIFADGAEHDDAVDTGAYQLVRVVGSRGEVERLVGIKLGGDGRIDAVRIYRWFTPLLHLDTHPKLVQYIKLAAAECGYGTEMVRAPRLPLTGKEREEVLALIRNAIKTRPGLANS